MRSYRYTKWYRSRHGLIFGVCQGFAEWKDMSVGMIRLVIILTSLFTGIFPVLLVYLGFAIFLPVEPRDPGPGGRGGFPPGDDPADFRTWRERDWDRRFHND
jgi:phage shock protein PspC (stress-responsive transcriptional regulator)